MSGNKLHGEDYTIWQLNSRLLLFQRYQHIIPMFNKSPFPLPLGEGFRWGRRPCLPWVAITAARPTYPGGDDCG